MDEETRRRLPEPPELKRAAGRLPRLVASVLIVAWTAAAETAPLVLEIKDPTRHWIENGFVEMVPPIRVSVAAGLQTETAIMLFVPDGQQIGVQAGLGGQPILSFPPGTVAERIAYRLFDNGQRRTVEDVRGTRWDDQGRELFHVYRAATPEPHSRLIGMEWRRDDPGEQEEATEFLTAIVGTTPMPISGRMPRSGDVARFRSMNACASCHVQGKPAAADPREPLPPWPTDHSGLYVPQAVLSDRAALSSTRMFHDPNAGDRFVRAECPDGDAEIVTWAYGRYYRCPQGGLPMGRRDMRLSSTDEDEHGLKVCRSRRYLFERMDAAARFAFREAFAVCGIE
jgi:hypothetical protein